MGKPQTPEGNSPGIPVYDINTKPSTGKKNFTLFLKSISMFKVFSRTSRAAAGLGDGATVAWRFPGFKFVQHVRKTMLSCLNKKRAFN